MIVFYDDEAGINGAELKDQEARHCSKVLRKREGDELFVTDGKGTLYRGSILSLTKSEVIIGSMEVISSSESKMRTGIAIAPTKNNSRIEWFVEKAVEIGISDIHLIETARSERSRVKIDRLQGIMISAMKQSKNFHLPQLHPLTSIKDLIEEKTYDQAFIAHCMDVDQHLLSIYDGKSSAIVLIGPEGDFTEDEVHLAKAHNFRETNLGRSRLRTETAGVVAAHLMQLALIK